MGHNRKHEA